MEMLAVAFGGRRKAVNQVGDEIGKMAGAVLKA
jgi:hypothetical protein